MNIKAEIDPGEIKRFISKMERYGKKVTKQQVKTKILRIAAKPVQQAMKSIATKGRDKVVNYYRGGEKVAEIHRGDLIRSIKIKKFRRNPSIYVGVVPSGKKKDTQGTYKGRRNWGWQGFWVEFGTPQQSARPFVKPGADRASGSVKNILAAEFKKLIEKSV
jgi:HK97 gp10 family phage protein